MKRRCFYLVTVTIFCLLVSPAFGATIYNNLTTTNAHGHRHAPGSRRAITKSRRLTISSWARRP